MVGPIRCCVTTCLQTRRFVCFFLLRYMTGQVFFFFFESAHVRLIMFFKKQTFYSTTLKKYCPLKGILALERNTWSFQRRKLLVSHDITTLGSIWDGTHTHTHTTRGTMDLSWCTSFLWPSFFFMYSIYTCMYVWKSLKRLKGNQ